MNDLSKIDAPLTAAQLKTHISILQDVMRSVMVPGVDYGRVPGCGDKPTLFKPGAEKILATFRIAVVPEADDLSTPETAHYRVRCKGMTPNGLCIGVGIGECSSDEEKYRWRRATCDEEFNATTADRRREKWIAPKNKPKFTVKQVRTNKADVANTVLKMAKKRSMIDMTLTATAASSCFEQDMADHDEPTAESLPLAGSAPAPVVDSNCVVGEVSSITQTGTSNGGMRFGIVSAGKTYYTFDEKVMEFAKTAGAAKRKVKIMFETGKYGADVVEISNA